MLFSRYKVQDGKKKKMLALIDRRHMIMNINKGIAQLTLFHQQEQVQSVGSFSLKKMIFLEQKKA